MAGRPSRSSWTDVQKGSTRSYGKVTMRHVSSVATARGDRPVQGGFFDDGYRRLADGSADISITSHSGALRGLYAVLGVPPRNLVVGEMNVLVLRVREVD